MYKNQLQELAQRSCFNLPSYACIREGPDHAPRFKASVNFNGEIFDSPTFFSTLRQAEHSAAEVALNTLAERGPSKTLAAKVLDETGVYKNLLQETAHRAGLNLPVYTTIHSGPGHVPVFSCTVELAGITFTGEPAKTKKQAQKNAAIAAWSTLKQMSQRGLSSSANISGGNEEQEQVVVARFLASLNPAEASNSSQSNQQKGHYRSPAFTTCKNSSPPTPASFGFHYQNWTSSNLSPEMTSHHMWLQEQAAEQQRCLMAIPIPIPIPPVPQPGQVVPWMHSMLQPSHHPYGLTGEPHPIHLSPGISMCTANSPFYLSNHIVRDPMKARSMVTIQEIQEEKLEDLSTLCPPEPSKAPVLNNHSSEHEKLPKEATQDILRQAKNITSSSLEIQEEGSPTFESSRQPNIGFSHAAITNNRGNTGIALSTVSQGVPVGPTQRTFRTLTTPPRMQSGVSSFSVRPRFGRMQAGGFRSPFTAPAVQIRSVVPVCSAAPPRRMTSSTQKEESSDDMRNRSTGDASTVSSNLGNLHI